MDNVSSSHDSSQVVQQKRLAENAFRGLFVVTWIRERQISNSRVTLILLRPTKEMSLTFGFEKEIVLALSEYPSLQARTMQAVNQACREEPLLGRIDQSVFFLHSPASDLYDFVSTYCSENPETRMVVPFSVRDFQEAIGDKWRIVNQIKDNLFIRNLFDYKLPIKNDAYFYGREEIVATIYDNIRKSQNTGIFGLRKTGKTSVLLKVQRLLRKANDVETIFFDCKKRSIRTSNADYIGLEILRSVERMVGRNLSKRIDSGEDVFDILGDAVLQISKDKKLCVIFDEIEYISPISPLDDWRQDFIDLWQSLWTIQTSSDKICFIVCGVNPKICEVDRFPSPQKPGRTVQNPMFNIFNVQFLRGISEENLRNMVQFFGARMGMRFDDSAISYLHDRYGGHPLLSRLACSYFHERLQTASVNRPVDIDRILLEDSQDDCDDELASYCGHVVAEIEKLYPDEYHMLELLAQGDVAEFFELSGDRSLVSHIRDYGLVEIGDDRFPRFSIPVVKRYLKNGMYSGSALQATQIDESQREGWLRLRLSSVSDGLQLVDSQCLESGEEAIYGGRGPSKLHRLMSLKVVVDRADAVDFLVEVYKVLIETADRKLRNGLLKNEQVRQAAPQTVEALNVFRTYRNFFCHSDVAGELKERFEGLTCPPKLPAL